MGSFSENIRRIKEAEKAAQQQRQREYDMWEKQEQEEEKNKKILEVRFAQRAKELYKLTDKTLIDLGAQKIISQVQKELRYNFRGSYKKYEGPFKMRPDDYKSTYITSGYFLRYLHPYVDVTRWDGGSSSRSGEVGLHFGVWATCHLDHSTLQNSDIMVRVASNVYADYNTGTLRLDRHLAFPDRPGHTLWTPYSPSTHQQVRSALENDIINIAKGFSKSGT